MNKTIQIAFAVVPFLLTVACTDPAKAPAQSAIRAGDGAVATLTDEVQKLAPEQVKTVKDALASAKSAAAKEDWKSALATAKDLPAAASEAVAAAKVKKEELEKAAAAKAVELKSAWEQAQAELPSKIGALKKQIVALSKAKKLPAGLTKYAVAKGKETVATLEAAYAKAAEQAKSDVEAAGAQAKELMAKAADMAASLTKK